MFVDMKWDVGMLIYGAWNALYAVLSIIQIVDVGLYIRNTVNSLVYCSGSTLWTRASSTSLLRSSTSYAPCSLIYKSAAVSFTPRLVIDQHLLPSRRRLLGLSIIPSPAPSRWSSRSRPPSRRRPRLCVDQNPKDLSLSQVQLSVRLNNLTNHLISLSCRDTKPAPS
jgi:hypothetical protein